MEQKVILVYEKNLMSLTERGSVPYPTNQFNPAHLLALTKQCGSTCPSSPKNRPGMGAWDKQELQAKASAPTEECEDHSISRGTTAAMALG